MTPLKCVTFARCKICIFCLGYTKSGHGSALSLFQKARAGPSLYGVLLYVLSSEMAFLLSIIRRGPRIMR
jgi:hypothetical protein